jgi:hypothetical protein
VVEEIIRDQFIGGLFAFVGLVFVDKPADYFFVTLAGHRYFSSSKQTLKQISQTDSPEAPERFQEFSFDTSMPGSLSFEKTFKENPMSKAESADLLMKLYDLRREATMREARNWFITFFPETAQDVLSAMMHPDSSAYCRMVLS